MTVASSVAAAPSTCRTSTGTTAVVLNSIDALHGGGKRVFAAIGAIVVVIGIALFLKYGVEQGWFAMADQWKEPQQIIDFEQGPPFRVHLFRLDDDRHVFFFMVHHLFWDGSSFDLLYREMAALYAALRHGTAAKVPALAVSYGDYAEWQRDRRVVIMGGYIEPPEYGFPQWGP